MKTKKLHKIAPTLSGIKIKGTGFQARKNYFNTIEEGVLSAVSENALPNFKTEENFLVPSNYFNKIEDVVIAKLKSEVTQNKNTEIPTNYFDTLEDRVLLKISKKQKVISLKNNIFKYAASIAIAASFAIFFMLNYQNTNSNITFDSLETAEIEQLVQSGIMDINTITLTQAFPDIELENSLNNDIISNDELLNYLDLENLESLLIEN